MQPEPQDLTVSQPASRSRAEILEHFHLGLLIGLMGFGVVTLGSFAMPTDHPSLTTLAIWGISLPLSTGVLAAALGEWGVTLAGGIMELLG